MYIALYIVCYKCTEMDVRTPVVPHVLPASLCRISGFIDSCQLACHCQVIAIPVHTVAVAKFSSPHKGEEGQPCGVPWSQVIFCQ